MYKSHGDLVLPLFSAEHQQLAIEIEWDGNTPLNLCDVETQAIVNTEIDWLVDCDDMSLGSTASNFIAIGDGITIGSFKLSTNRVSFNSTPEVRNF